MNAPARLTTIQWLICAVAALGFAFDSYVLLMLPIIIRTTDQMLSLVLIGQRNSLREHEINSPRSPILPENRFIACLAAA